MAKKNQSGVYLGETRRQRASRMRNLGLIVILLLLTVIASVLFVAWLLDRAQPVQTGKDMLLFTEQTGAVSDTESDAADIENISPEMTAPTTEPIETSPAVIPTESDAYKPLQYTDVWSVMIDPGHGFDDIGTSSSLLGDVNEATVNLDIALRVRQILSENETVSVIMTHDDNAVDGRVSAADGGEPPLNNLVLLTPEDRAVLANGQDIDLFVSLHCDSLPENPDISGMRVYYYDGDAQNEQRNNGAACLASGIADAFVPITADGTPTPLVKTMADDDAFYVIKKIGVPSVLCEVGFVTNQTDAANMLDAGWRQAAAQAIADGIISYISKTK